MPTGIPTKKGWTAWPVVWSCATIYKAAFIFIAMDVRCGSPRRKIYPDSDPNSETKAKWHNGGTVPCTLRCAKFIHFVYTSSLVDVGKIFLSSAYTTIISINFARR